MGLALGSCAVGPHYTPPTAAVLKVPAGYQSPQTVTSADISVWWTSLNDPVLTGLVNRTLAGSTDLDAARARLRAARASVKSARGVLLPSIGGSLNASDQESVNGQNITGSNYQAAVDAAWEADIFGGNKHSLEAAKATAANAQATLYDVQRTITAELVLNYIDARTIQARLAVARANLRTQDDTLEISGWRNKAGLATALDVEQSRVLRAQTAASIPLLEQTYVNDTNRIAVLTGEAPGAVAPLMNAIQPIPLAPDTIAANLPAALLERRPDVLAAEATYAAQVARVGVAKAQLYPSLRLSGSLTTSAFSVGDIGSSILANLASGITIPLFQGGQLRAAVEAQQATADAALATYRGTLLTALEDVENALVALDKAKLREAQLLLAEQSAQNAASYARNRYRAGLIDFQSLLDTERSLLSSQDSRISSRAARTNAAVQLYKALGGGWPANDTLSMRR